MTRRFRAFYPRPLPSNFGLVSSWVDLFTTLFSVNYTLRQFSANFGVPPEVCCYLWLKAPLEGNGLKPKHLLMLLAFLKSNDTFDSLSAKFGVTEKTFRVVIYKVAKILTEHLDLIKLMWRKRIPPIPVGDIPVHLVIDCTVCPIEPPLRSHDWSIQKPFYSGKHHLHCLKYECGVRPDGLICWVNGPYPGSMHDLNVFRRGLLTHHLGKEEMILGDKAYVSKKEPFITPIKKRVLTPDQKRFNDIISGHRVVVEHTFAEVKTFRSMTTPWRAALTRHEDFFFIVANLVNLKKLWSIHHRNQ